MLRYVVVALGDTAGEIEVEQEDLDVVKERVDRTGFEATILSERASRALTAALLLEAIA